MCFVMTFDFDLFYMKVCATYFRLSVVVLS